MKEFFVNSNAYELPHLLFIAYFLISTTLLILFTILFAKSEKAKTLVVKISAGVLLFLVILSRFIYNDFKPTILQFLPNTFCSTMGFIYPLFLLFSKKDSKSLFFAVFSALMGGLITIFSGDDIGQERIQNTIISYIYHSFMASVSLLCFSIKYCRPSVDKILNLIIGLCIMVVYGVFSNQVFNYTNNMFLNEPLIKDSIFTWWFTGLIMLLIALILTIVYESFSLKKEDQTLYKIFKKSRIK